MWSPFRPRQYMNDHASCGDTLYMPRLCGDWTTPWQLVNCCVCACLTQGCMNAVQWLVDICTDWTSTFTCLHNAATSRLMFRWSYAAIRIRCSPKVRGENDCQKDSCKNDAISILKNMHVPIYSCINCKTYRRRTSLYNCLTSYSRSSKNNIGL